MSRWWMTAGMCFTLLFASAATSAAAAADNGAEDIMMDGGSRGLVFFPHWQHQGTEPITCQACHELFPKEPGSIGRLKGEGALKARQVMNTLCISCHRETAAAGKPSGPRSCNTCHK